MNKISFVLVLFLITSLAACNLPKGQATPSSPEAVYTQAAQTVAAELTQIALLASPTPNVPTSTFTPSPTNTTIPIITDTPVPCNLAGFVTDVTYPDNTQVAAGQPFNKIWRLQNSGTCTWSSAYSVVFDHGNGMGIPAGYTQPLTAGTVPPGGIVDISVNLTAPAAPGTYRGDWHLREPGGQPFGTNFIVVIKVVSVTTVTLNVVGSESGAVQADGVVFPGDIVVGDSTTNFSLQAFLSFDISGIPSNATIMDVITSFNNYTTGGDAFARLGILNGYAQTYILPLAASDFVAGLPSGNVMAWGGTGALNEVETQPTLKSALQAKVGTNRLYFRLQFAGTNNDNTTDFVRFTTPTLMVTYTTP